MIVDTMSHAEVYQELERDREAISTWWHHNLNSQRRRVLKSTRFPVQLWFEYTSPRRNRYYFYTRIYEKRMRRILTGIIVVRQGKDGMTVYTNWLGHQKLIAPMVLTPHMWRQYQLRCNIQKSGIELIKHYLEQNPQGKDSDNQHVVGRSVRYNGEEHQSCCVPEGVLLGQVHDGIYLVKTFITYDMCCGRQQQEFEHCRSQIIGDDELYARERAWYDKPYNYYENYQPGSIIM